MKEHPKRGELLGLIMEYFDDAISPVSIIPDNKFADDIITLFEDEWIPVTERLPEKDEPNSTTSIDVLITDGERITKGFYSFEFDDEWICEYPEIKVTHWKPLPNPPKK